MNSRSVEYSEKSLKKALDLQKKLDANYGGTEILAPLEAIYKQDVISTHSRQVQHILKLGYLSIVQKRIQGFSDRGRGLANVIFGQFFNKNV